jgi:hypothetical protein
MRKLLPLVVAFSSLMAIAACSDEDGASGRPAVNHNEKNQDLQKRADAERDARLRIEDRLMREQSNANWWQAAACVLAITVVVVLVAGIVIGSSARHESER